MENNQSNETELTDEQYDALFDETDMQLIEVFGGIQPIVDFSVDFGDDDKPEMVAEHLHAVAAVGKCMFYKNPWDNCYSEAYVSDVVENPTWGDVCVMANKAIVMTHDYDHRFLEGIEFIENDDDVKIYAFNMGS
jgi:hypothetical protein